MHYPSFYTQVPTIKLYDPLSDFLGALSSGRVEISYLDCVKVAGHSCPTVAGAYLMASKGLQALYGKEVPQRAKIRIEMKEAEDEGVTGVTAAVMSFILGASAKGGFKGIQGNFSRDKLLFFQANIEQEVKFTRLDNMQSVNLAYNPTSIETDARIPMLMKKNLSNTASIEEKRLFQLLWQERVEEILLSTDKHDTILTLSY